MLNLFQHPYLHRQRMDPDNSTNTRELYDEAKRAFLDDNSEPGLKL
jgi:hypothetical protein